MCFYQKSWLKVKFIFSTRIKFCFFNLSFMNNFTALVWALHLFQRYFDGGKKKIDKCPLWFQSNVPNVFNFETFYSNHVGYFIYFLCYFQSTHCWKGCKANTIAVNLILMKERVFEIKKKNNNNKKSFRQTLAHTKRLT